MPVQPFRPRQVDLCGQRSVSKDGQRTLWPARQWKKLAVLAFAAAVVNLGLTQLLEGRTVALAARIEQLHRDHAELARVNMRLMASELALTSKSSLTAATKKKVQLCEPGQGQIRRISSPAGNTPLLRKENNFLTFQDFSLPDPRESRQ